ncbi:MAG: NTP transferase domain-containing protein [Actinobacteria bacterium]|nr:NTP transferase domain-containing protein [Actinomycetota bacterium]
MSEARGAVLAGGRGSRLGGAKATAILAGRPLITYPLAALAAAGIDAFVVAKASSGLRGRPSAPTTGLKTTAARGPGQRTTAPALGEVEIVTEPAEPTHPLVGIIAALRHAGAPLVILGCDFPFAPPPLLRALAEAPEPLVVPAPGSDPQPLVARWSPELLPALAAALDREEPLRRTITALAPRLLDDAELARFGDPARTFFNVNTPADLREAERVVERGG